jgi:hypothetical protein
MDSAQKIIRQAENNAHEVVSLLNRANLTAIDERNTLLHIMLMHELEQAIALRDRINAIRQAVEQMQPA